MNRSEFEVSLFILMVSCCCCGDSSLAPCSAGLKFCFCFCLFALSRLFYHQKPASASKKDIYFNSTNVLLVGGNNLSIDETMFGEVIQRMLA